MDIGIWLIIILALLALSAEPLMALLSDLGYSRGGEKTESVGSHLIFLAKRGNAKKMRRLLGKEPGRYYLDHKDDDGMTALMYAAREGHVEIAQILLEEGADVSKICGDKKTALTFAEENGNIDISDLLKGHSQKA